VPLAVFGMLVANINQISASEAFPWSKADDDTHDVHGSGMMRIAVYGMPFLNELIRNRLPKALRSINLPKTSNVIICSDILILGKNCSVFLPCSCYYNLICWITVKRLFPDTAAFEHLFQAEKLKE